MIRETIVYYVRVLRKQLIASAVCSILYEGGVGNDISIKPNNNACLDDTCNVKLSNVLKEISDSNYDAVYNSENAIANSTREVPAYSSASDMVMNSFTMDGSMKHIYESVNTSKKALFDYRPVKFILPLQEHCSIGATNGLKVPGITYPGKDETKNGKTILKKMINIKCIMR